MAMVKKTNLRRTGGRKSTTVIQSPTVKRVHSRPVTLQGWLLKRGSDGLMLWKKRWFVLSDYCLFYYKDPEEEVLLGSFVLASWIISPCTHKDKVYKKYSFKAEHNNMRTYYFAADNDVIMAQWLKALTMASLLQESPRLTSKINNSQMNQMRPKEHNLHRSQQPPVGYNYGFHSSGRVINADNQPLYVNAPPKPKRLNDGSTPDPTEEESRMLMYHEGTSSDYYNNGPVMPGPVHYGPGPPGMNGSHNLNNVTLRTNVVANSYHPPPTAASHYECLRTSYTLNQVAGGVHPPRPRSVDFLEYDNKLPHNLQNPAAPKLITLPRRPKSSMSISAPKDEPMDSTAWSEESYAKKMRESAMYVRADNDNSTASIRTASSQHDRDVVSPINENIEGSNSSAVLLQKNMEPTRDMDMDPNIFKRSASARLPEVTKPANDPYGRDIFNASVTPDSKKVQQREESMRRLLEWKQRMLQSPLSHKPNSESGNFVESSNARGTPPRRADLNTEIALHLNNTKENEIGRRDLLEIRSHSVPISDVEHPYDMGHTNYNTYAYKGTSRRMELEAAEEETKIATSESSATKKKNDTESSKQIYSALSFDYPPSEDSPYIVKHSSGSQVNYYAANCEPGYSGSAITKVPNGYPASREGTLHRGPNSLKRTTKGTSVCETDEEWGLKLDESSVIKEFSYHYIKNDDADGHSLGNHSMDSPNHKFINRRQPLQNVQTSITMSHNHPLCKLNEAPSLPNEVPQPSPSRNKPFPAGILKNIKSRKKLDLESTVDVNSRKAKWNQPYSSEIHNNRQVFSDTETLLYETSSEAEDREKACTSAKFSNVSSDDDRDEEVAAVLSKEHKTHTGHLEKTKTPPRARPSSSGFYSTQEPSAVQNHLSISCENITEIPEENYMPMTPRKRTVSASPLKDDGSVMSPVMSNIENETLLGIEECPYVEMTQSSNSKSSLMQSNLDSSQCLNPDVKYFNSPSSLVDSRRGPYDNSYHNIPGQEPLYMEVSNIENKSQEYHNQLHSTGKADEGGGEEEDTREGHTVNGALPDILNTTAPSLLHHGSRRSDSSDADDEASKDLDSIDAPRHPRFSLSDTFRPASYYLGSSLNERAIIALNSSDHHDSSDSDLVSPPPIPACSPPLDDLDTSIDSTINNKELGLVNSKEDYHPTAVGEDEFRYGCISKNSLPVSSSHNETGSSEEESVKSVRTRHFMKRRPLSADILNSLSDFNILDSSSEVKEPTHYDPYERNDAKLHHLKMYNTAAGSPTMVPVSDKYNPYRKNGLNSRNKPSYDWGQPTSARSSYHEANLLVEVKDMQVPLNVSISGDRKYGENCMIEAQPYNLPLSARAHLVSYDVSPQPPSVSQDCAYANSAMLVQDCQNNAPYYYSDLFKVDSRNSLNRVGKSEDQMILEKNNLTRSYSEDGSIVTRNNYPNHGTNSSGDPLMHAENMRDSQVPPGPYNSFTKSNHFPDEKRIDSHRRARSLEGLLDSKGLSSSNPGMLPMNVAGEVSVSKHRPPPAIPPSRHNPPMPVPQRPYHTDVEWLGGSRRAVRHARSLEELDRKGEGPTSKPTNSHNEVVYANSDFPQKGHEVSDQRVSTEKEREKIRQWDLMSSAPSTLGQEVPSYKDNPTPKILANNHTNGSAKQEVLQPITSTDDNQKANWELKFSAGDLLGRTHEELVLLLIQLRRQRASVCKSMERCHREIEAHACLTDFDSINRPEHIQKLDELKARLIELEKQYEKGKPLVNLVDNMVKLGSLYQSGPQSISPEKLEFNHKVQEQRILADERRDWERLRADHQELQAKVEQLYRLDKLLQEESGTLHSLQEDKGVLERALGGLKSKLQGIHGNTAETEWYRRQQRLLERELSRVRSILALNSKKLEETVAENARLEQELVVLRQKLQMSRRTAEPGGAATAALESELCRVQLLVGNLLRQRQELSAQVRQLTEKSNSLSQQIWPSITDNQAVSNRPGTSAISKKKHNNSGWIETDLDMGGIQSPGNEDGCSSTKDRTMSPLYVNTNNTDKQHAYYVDHSTFQEDCLDEMSPLNARSPDPYRSDVEDDGNKKTCGSNWREKPQEIKTVRIVKRESERRQRDRDHRSGNIGIPLTCNSKRVIPEEVTLVPISEKQSVDPPRDETCPPGELSEPPPTPGPRSDSVHAVWNIVRKNKLKGNILSGGPMEHFEPPDINEESPQLSPVYLSEAARKIVEEVAWQGRGEKRLIPRERRRHHTVSGLSLNPPKHLYSQKGSRDDLDMERVLRPRLTTPDVVRSTLNRSDASFTKETIDNILGAPGKILIPERYIPESQPQLSKEEIIKRSKKADAIRKMLCETAPTVGPKEGELKERPQSVKHQAEEEKRNREHLLQLSQILAQEVMEKSKIVAGVNSPLPQD